MPYLPRDYVSTADGLLLAVVASDLEQGRVLCCLRYASVAGRLRKLDSQQAHRHLQELHPDYLFFSPQRDVWLPAVPAEDVVRHYCPRQRVQDLLAAAGELAPLELRLIRLLRVLAAAGLPPAGVGVTGSLLVGTHQADSDIDLVLYDRQRFADFRRRWPELIGQQRLAELSPQAWHEAYLRRGCSLSFDEYLWHERRKANKALFEGTKVDIGLVSEAAEEAGPWRKRGACCQQLLVTDDRFAYDFPARYGVAGEGFAEVVSFTATYTGQAVTGEWIEATGWLEESPDGRRRIVVGSDREAQGQFIRVLQ